MNWTDSLAPLRERNFAWYYAARIASMTGSMMVTVALAFAVLDISDSASALGLVLAAHTVPMVLFLLFGGVISDRFDRALIMQLSGLLSALTQGAVAFLVISGIAELWMVIALEVVNGMVTAISFPAMPAWCPSSSRAASFSRQTSCSPCRAVGSRSSGRPWPRSSWSPSAPAGHSRSTRAPGCSPPASSRR